eukprot:4062665-Prymnesium_polylepis.2
MQAKGGRWDQTADDLHFRAAMGCMGGSDNVCVAWDCIVAQESWHGCLCSQYFILPSAMQFAASSHVSRSCTAPTDRV